MRNIWTVFKTDIRTLSKCFFACVVVVAIALLPSLYAWLNIYSNWDPYGNTGGISIAVASLDEGYTDADGTYENKGDDVVADLREAMSINWVIVDTEEEAKGGVESGDYYAAVVIDKQFSRNMYRMLTDWTGKPAITYYENAKKNAVATKITDTAVETLKRSISENYLEVVIDGIMEQSNLLAADLTADDPEAAVKGVLYQAQDLLHACGRMMDAFEAAGGSGVSESSAAALEAAVANINKNLPDGAQLQQTAAEIQLQLNTALARVERALDRLNSAIENAPDQKETQQKLLDAADTMDKTADALETWAAGLEASGTEAGKTQAEAARQTAAECRKTAKQLRALAESPDSADLLADCDALVKSIRTMVDKIPVTSKALQKELDTVAGQVADTMEGMAALAGDAKVMKTALAETADAVGDTMNAGRIVIHGSIGDAAGYAMRGGELYVEGNAGYRAGIHMKAYGDKLPVMVIGGKAGSFLGEYQAGGIIIVLGLTDGPRPIVSNFPCTGMHGGKLYIRSDCKKLLLPKQVIARPASRKDMNEVRDYLHTFCQLFGGNCDALLRQPFTVITPNSSNPYKQLYVTN